MSTSIESMRRIRFPRPDSARFVREVKQRVAAHFEARGLSKHANAAMVAKTFLILAMAFVPYGLILTGWFTPWQMLALAILMGVGVAGVGFSIAHDALHGAYSSRALVNRLLGFSFDLMGANGYMWKITHNVIHHTYTNIPGVDEDLTVSPILRLSPGAPRKWYHRYQQLYALPAYSLATLNWIFLKDFQQFLKKDIGPYQNKSHPAGEVAILVGMKLLTYAWMIVVPLLVLDVAWWQFVIGFVAMHLVAGAILGIIFQLAHVVEGTDYPEPDADGWMEHAWILHEMETTSNFAHRNRLLSWYIGGLNYQIEHHLFPQVCSIHYPKVSAIVRQAAEETGVPYHLQPTLRSAMASHYRMLKRLGRADGLVPAAAPRAPALAPA